MHAFFRFIRLLTEHAYVRHKPPDPALIAIATCKCDCNGHNLHGVVEYAKACCKCVCGETGRESALKCKRLAFSFQGARGRKGGSRILLVSQWRQWTDVIRIYRRRDTMVLMLPKAELIFCDNFKNSKFKEYLIYL